MGGRHRREFMTAQRVAGQNRRGEMKRIEDGENILAQPLFAETRFRAAGRAVSPPGYAVNVTKANQLEGKIVKDVGRMSRPGQQHKRATRSSPIKHLELDVIFDTHKLDPVRRGILPLGL